MGNATDFIQPLLDAVSHQEAGRWSAAASGFATVLAIEPEQPQALLFAGVLAHREGRSSEAVALLERAAAVRPENAEVRFALGNALWTAGARGAAREAWAETLRLQRRHVGAMLNMARALEFDGEYDLAVMTCRGAVACRPDDQVPRTALAAAQRSAGRLADSLAAADEALGIDPWFGPAHYQRGTTLKALGRLEEAAVSLGEATRLCPDDASGHLNLANTLFDLGDPDAAERSCRKAIECDPAMPEAHAALGFFLTQSMRLPEAIAACEEAVRLDPDLAEGHWNMGIAMLSSGDLPGGFARYEWRKRHPQFARQFRALPTPEWDGGPLEGKRLLVLAEQGMGDALMFVRYASVLTARGATVWYACDRRLVPLLKDAPGVAAAVPNSLDLPRHDVWVDQMSLPLLCGTTLETIPSPGPYLAADRRLVAKWRARLGGGMAGAVRIGVAWAGNPLHLNDRNRSCPIDAFRPVLGLAGVEGVSLQVGPRAAEAAALGLPDWSAELADFAQTAALVETLDLVVTVDTSVAHLAAAMGKPTWIMLPHCAEWRWLQGCDDTPWYETVRLFRQQRPGDWDSCAQEIVGLLG